MMAFVPAMYVVVVWLFDLKELFIYHPSSFITARIHKILLLPSTIAGICQGDWGPWIYPATSTIVEALYVLVKKTLQCNGTYMLSELFITSTSLQIILGST